MDTAINAEFEVLHTRALFRHILATIAYRGGKILRDAPEAYLSFRAGETARTSAQILAHMADLLEWALRLAEGTEQWRAAWRPVAPGNWNSDVARFFDALKRLDALFATAQPSSMTIEILFQGPISDVLTHIGQLAMLRRLAGSPVRGEVMIIADVEIGRVGPDQAAPKREFD
ncbi:MAG TPA: hypothetical protein VMU48_04415 [Terracidiphilus sp.]|nr:hypothetical protein [Terracidiphilus sp.]